MLTYLKSIYFSNSLIHILKFLYGYWRFFVWNVFVSRVILNKLSFDIFFIIQNFRQFLHAEWIYLSMYNLKDSSHQNSKKKKQVTLMVSTVSTVLYRPKYGKPDSKSPEQTITNIIVIDHFGSLCICFSMNLVRSHNKIFSFLRVFQEIMSSFKWARKVKYTELAWERVLL